MSKLRRRKKNQKGDKFTLINQVYMEYNITQTIFLISIITPFAWLYVRVGKLLTCGKHVHDGIISLRGEVLAPKTKSIPPPFIEVSVQSQNVSSHEFACLGYIFYHFLRFLII
jgi:hypothetical protein